jgi:2-methylisocitrate lyase-like PEP mutase family enzyme
MRPDQLARAQQFRALHRGPGTLVLGSVWDPASAVIFQREGFKALGTSSAGIAYAHGLPDGEVLSLDHMIDAVGSIASAVDIPVSADLESGFGDEPEAIARVCLRAAEAGAVGVNLEDAAPGTTTELFDLDRQCEVIRTVRRAADGAGVPLFINARTDGFWLNLWDPATRLRESIARGQAYVAAGADGVFVPGALEPDVIAKLADAINAPLNILAMPGCLAVGILEALGVRRLSQGSGPARAALGLSRRIARELLDQGEYSSFHQGAIGYREANLLFANGGQRSRAPR